MNTVEKKQNRKETSTLSRQIAIANTEKKYGMKHIELYHKMYAKKRRNANGQQKKKYRNEMLLMNRKNCSIWKVHLWFTMIVIVRSTSMAENLLLCTARHTLLVLHRCCHWNTMYYGIRVVCLICAFLDFFSLVLSLSLRLFFSLHHSLDRGFFSHSMPSVWYIFIWIPWIYIADAIHKKKAIRIKYRYWFGCSINGIWEKVGNIYRRSQRMARRDGGKEIEMEIETTTTKKKMYKTKFSVLSCIFEREQAFGYERIGNKRMLKRTHSMNTHAAYRSTRSVQNLTVY